MAGDIDVSVLHFKYHGELRHWSEMGFEEIKSLTVGRPQATLRFLVTYEDVQWEANFALGLDKDGTIPTGFKLDDKKLYNINAAQIIPHHNFLLLLSWFQVHDSGIISVSEQSSLLMSNFLKNCHNYTNRKGLFAPGQMLEPYEPLSSSNNPPWSRYTFTQTTKPYPSKDLWNKAKALTRTIRNTYMCLYENILRETYDGKIPSGENTDSFEKILLVRFWCKISLAGQKWEEQNKNSMDSVQCTPNEHDLPLLLAFKRLGPLGVDMLPSKGTVDTPSVKNPISRSKLKEAKTASLDGRTNLSQPLRDIIGPTAFESPKLELPTEIKEMCRVMKNQFEKNERNDYNIIMQKIEYWHQKILITQSISKDILPKKDELIKSYFEKIEMYDKFFLDDNNDDDDENDEEHEPISLNEETLVHGNSSEIIAMSPSPPHTPDTRERNSISSVPDSSTAVGEREEKKRRKSLRLKN